MAKLQGCCSECKYSRPKNVFHPIRDKNKMVAYASPCTLTLCCWRFPPAAPNENCISINGTCGEWKEKE